jgi:hypothetical protein
MLKWFDRKKQEFLKRLERTNEEQLRTVNEV